MITIMLETSLRCGELIGLTYNDVNLEKKELYVTHQLTYRNYQDGEGCKFRIKKTKTDAVIYALSDFLIMILSWLVKQSLRAFLFQEVQL